MGLKNWRERNYKNEREGFSSIRNIRWDDDNVPVFETLVPTSHL